MKKTVILLSFCILFSAVTASAKEYYVSLSGDDSWSGELSEPNGSGTDGPFKTIIKARDVIRQMKQNQGLPSGGITIYIRGGIYSMSSMITFSDLDSGTEDAPIVYTAYPGEEVRFLGGKVVTGFESVTDEAIRSRFCESCRDNIVQADLKAQGVSNYGGISQAEGSELVFYFQSKAMTLARYPNDGFLTIMQVPIDCEEPFVGDPRTVRADGTSNGMHCGKLRYTNPLVAPIYQMTRPEQWAPADDIWMFGYWYHDWSSMYQKVESIDTKKKDIYLTPPFHFYGYRGGQRYYFFNVIEELDMPGEWYLDRTNGILYFWPPSPIQKGDAFVSTMRMIMVYLNNTSYVTLRGITFEGTQTQAVLVNGGTHNLIDGCRIRNIGGEYCIELRDGTENGVINCEILDVAGGGIILGGGDRKTITPAGNYVINNHIHDYAQVYRTYRAAVALSGVGNIISHNLIHDAPHQAIALSGNEHIIEYNEIHDVVEETDDAGAIYGAADWTMRGTIIRYNYFHHFQGPKGFVMAIYFDPPYSGNTIFGNVFYKVSRGVLLNSGRDNTFENNIFVECGQSIWINQYVDPQLYQKGGDWGIYENLIAMNYKEPPYSERYPELLNLYEDGDPSVPRGNVVRRNIHYKGDNWFSATNFPVNLVTIEDNLVGEDPHFVDMANENFQLKDDSPAYTKIGFQRIPFEDIGLLDNPIDVDVEDDKPELFKLDQNVPNPFNPATVIRFSLTQGEKVKLSVYNLLGQEVAVLADGYMKAGTHKVVFDGGGFASGVYFYRLASGTVVKTKKMLLVK